MRSLVPGLHRKTSYLNCLNSVRLQFREVFWEGPYKRGDLGRARGNARPCVLGAVESIAKCCLEQRPDRPPRVRAQLWWYTRECRPGRCDVNIAPRYGT